MKTSAIKLYIPVLFKSNITPLLLGPPGVGKSSIVRDICRDIYKDCKIKIIQASLINLGDICVYIPDPIEKRLKEYVMDIEDGSIILIDDITLADITQIRMFLQMIYEKRIGNKSLSKCKVILTGNRVEDGVGISDIPKYLSNRVCIIDVEVDVQDWIRWAYKNDVHKSVIDFIKMDNARLYMYDKSNRVYPSPRSWESVSNFLKELCNSGIDIGNEGVCEIICGLIGPETGSLFYEFIKYRVDFDPMESLMTGNLGKSKFYVKGKEFNDSLCMYSRLLYLCDYIVNTIKCNKVLPDKDMYRGLEKIWKSLSGEYRAVFIRGLVQKDVGGYDLSVIMHIIDNLSGDVVEDIGKEVDQYRRI